MSLRKLMFGLSACLLLSSGVTVNVRAQLRTKIRSVDCFSGESINKAECCVVNTDASVLKDTLLCEYTEWCKSSNIKPIGRNTFYEALRRAIPDLDEGAPSGGRRHFIGVGLLTDDQS